MQLQFGVLGGGPAADATFARLASSTAAGGDGPAPRLAESSACRVGSIDRSSASWQVPGTDRWFHVDGEIRVIDGADTTGKGLDEAGRAALARLYDRAGTDAWSRLDGSFCLVVRDGATVHVVMDVVGARAVYWWVADGLLAFHSHLLDLAPAYPGPLTEDLGAIGSFLECGRYLPTTTPWREVRHLGAGQALTFAEGRAVVRDHFAMPFEADPPAVPDERVVNDVVGLLEASVARCWRGADAPVVPLSGGMDSRYIAAELVRRNGPRSVPTITWGEGPMRPGCDAIVAARVAQALDLQHDWFEKRQRHTTATFERALYLASGEGDCAIHYPNDHGLHAELEGLGYRSLFRGDECFGSGDALLTDAAVPIVNGLAPIGRDAAYRALLGDDLFGRVSAEQEPALRATVDGLRSATPTSRRGELWYGVGVRRFLGPYNRVKQANLEVYAPLLDRALLERLRATPDRLRANKALLQAALDRRFPELSGIAYATDDNLPRWEARMATDPTFARVLLDRCAAPGWLDTIGARERVEAALTELEAAAARRADAGSEPAAVSAGSSTAGQSGDGAPSRLRWAAKRTWPGRMARELTLERRFASNLPNYLRLARLTVLHELLADRPGA